MRFPDFILELGQRLGNGAAAARDTQDAIFRVTLTNGTELSLEGIDDGRRLAISALLCRYPADEQRLALFDRLMEAHAFGLATDGAHFAASRRAGKVVMAKVLDLADARFDDLLVQLDAFAAQFQAWRADIDAARPAAADASPALPARPGSFA